MRILLVMSLVIGFPFIVMLWVFPNGLNSTYFDLLASIPRFFLVFIVALLMGIPMGVWSIKNKRSITSNGKEK